MQQPAIVTDNLLSKYSGEHLLHELNMLWETASRIPQEKQRSFMSSSFSNRSWFTCVH